MASYLIEISLMPDSIPLSAPQQSGPEDQPPLLSQDTSQEEDQATPEACWVKSICTVIITVNQIFSHTMLCA